MLQSNLIEEGYKIDAKRTKELIRRELDFMKGSTCIDLALATKQLKFISHPSVLNISNSIWRGPWKYEFTIFDFIGSFSLFYLMKLECHTDRKIREFSELTGEYVYQRKEWKIAVAETPAWIIRDKWKTKEDNGSKVSYLIALYFPRLLEMLFFWMHSGSRAGAKGFHTAGVK